jgi:plasmid stability protein
LATLAIRNLDNTLHNRLKADAAMHGRFMEEEVRCILRERLLPGPGSPGVDWVDAIRALFEPLGGLEISDIDRPTPRDPPDFSGPGWNPSR